MCARPCAKPWRPSHGQDTQGPCGTIFWLRDVLLRVAHTPLNPDLAELDLAEPAALWNMSDSKSLKLCLSGIVQKLMTGLSLSKRKAILLTLELAKLAAYLSRTGLFCSVCCTLGPPKGVVCMALAGASLELGKGQRLQHPLVRAGSGPSAKEMKFSSVAWFFHFIRISPMCYLPGYATS